MTPRPITIVGGGLAGLSLGILLRRENIPVTIWEAGNYPRHRVCGEFISGRGQEVLKRLGLMEKLNAAGFVRVATAKLVAARNGSPVRAIAPAIGISRFKLDALLAEEFQRLGGCLNTNDRFSDKAGEGIVHASGRRPRPVVDGWRWFGLKAHARNVNLSADLELHVDRDCYVGISRIEDATVNVCGLFRTRPGQAHSISKLELLRGGRSSTLNALLGPAEWIEGTFCSVAGLSLSRDRAEETDEIRIGDAMTMIPPATGNGMSMALESAEIAARSLMCYCIGASSWESTRLEIARNCNRTFAARLRWAGLLQRLLLSELPRSVAGKTLLQMPVVWNAFFKRTR